MIYDFIAGVVIGLFITIFFFGAYQLVNPYSSLNEAFKAIEICEKNLPRNQTCILTALPKGN